jgi:hypothetical protein
MTLGAWTVRCNSVSWPGSSWLSGGAGVASLKSPFLTPSEARSAANCASKPLRSSVGILPRTTPHLPRPDGRNKMGLWKKLFGKYGGAVPQPREAEKMMSIPFRSMASERISARDSRLYGCPEEFRRRRIHVRAADPPSRRIAMSVSARAYFESVSSTRRAPLAASWSAKLM